MSALHRASKFCRVRPFDWKRAQGTSLHTVVIWYPKQIGQLFGGPDRGGDKAHGEMMFEDKAGEVVTLYDYDEKIDPWRRLVPYEFHLGATVTSESIARLDTFVRWVNAKIEELNRKRKS